MSQKHFEKLLSNLVKETKYQEKLLSLLTEERSSIITLKTEILADLQQKKEKLLTEISQHSHERSSILGQLGFTPETSKTKEGNKNLKLTDCIQECQDSKIRSELLKTCENLKVSAETARSLNRENNDLIKTSLGLVSNTISIINARPAIDDTNYKRNGTVNSQNSTTAKSLIPASSFSKSA